MKGYWDPSCKPMSYTELVSTSDFSFIQRDRRKAERRNQLQANFDGAMVGVERKFEELIEAAADES